MNPMKLMKARKQFSEAHPKFVNFARDILGSGMPEGTIVEITVTKPGMPPVTSNIAIKQSDLELFEELKGL